MLELGLGLGLLLGLAFLLGFRVRSGFGSVVMVRVS